MSQERPMSSPEDIFTGLLVAFLLSILCGLVLIGLWGLFVV